MYRNVHMHWPLHAAFYIILTGILFFLWNFATHFQAPMQRSVLGSQVLSKSTSACGFTQRSSSKWQYHLYVIQVFVHVCAYSLQYSCIVFQESITVDSLVFHTILPCPVPVVKLCPSLTAHHLPAAQLTCGVCIMHTSRQSILGVRGLQTIFERCCSGWTVELTHFI